MLRSRFGDSLVAIVRLAVSSWRLSLLWGGVYLAAVCVSQARPSWWWVALLSWGGLLALACRAGADEAVPGAGNKVGVVGLLTSALAWLIWRALAGAGWLPAPPNPNPGFALVPGYALLESRGSGLAYMAAAAALLGGALWGSAWAGARMARKEHAGSGRDHPIRT